MSGVICLELLLLKKLLFFKGVKSEGGWRQQASFTCNGRGDALVALQLGAQTRQGDRVDTGPLNHFGAFILM